MPKEAIVALAVNATVNVVQMYGCIGVALLGKLRSCCGFQRKDSGGSFNVTSP